MNRAVLFVLLTVLLDTMGFGLIMPVMPQCPPLMTQLFGYFSAEAAPVQFPGAAFFFAWVLSLASLTAFWNAVRLTLEPAAVVGGA
jgi:hypothetical protein